MLGIFGHSSNLGLATRSRSQAPPATPGGLARRSEHLEVHRFTPDQVADPASLSPRESAILSTAVNAKQRLESGFAFARTLDNTSEDGDPTAGQYRSTLTGPGSAFSFANFGSSVAVQADMTPGNERYSETQTHSMWGIQSSEYSYYRKGEAETLLGIQNSAGTTEVLVSKSGALTVFIDEGLTQPAPTWY